jgi:hypothetical protein
MKAAPEGVMMDRVPAPLDEQSQCLLHSICAEFNVLERYELIELETRRLRDFESHGKSNMKSTQGQIKAMKSVEDAAKNLALAIDELEESQRRDIFFHLPPDGLKVLRSIEKRLPGCTVQFGIEEVDCHVSYPVSSSVLGRVSYIGLEANRLSTTIHEMQKTTPKGEHTGGRKRTLDEYAKYIFGISSVPTLLH